MFRSTKKKKKPAAIRKQVIPSTKDEESEEEQNTVIRLKHKPKTKKKAGLVVRSFDFNETKEEEDDNSKGKRGKKRKKRKGLGFGGAPITSNSNSMEEQDDEQYGMEALERLKNEQKRKPPKMSPPPPQSMDTTEVIRTPTEEEAPVKATATAAAAAAADFISLDVEDKHNHQAPMMEEILEPTDALQSQFSQQQQQLIEEQAEIDDWEDQIARRAGLSSASTSTTLPRHTAQTTTTNTKPTPLPSFQALRNQLYLTLDNLQKVQEDLGYAIMRRQADLQQANADQTRQQQSVDGTGRALHDYQVLRNHAAMWVGALRELKTKVDPILETLIQLVLSNLTTAQQEWRYSQDDAISLLQQAGLLDQVVGRQPPLPPADAAVVTVDEFGRDVQSQFLRDREKRYRARMERLNQDKEKDPLLNIWNHHHHHHHSQSNKEALERYHILQEALKVAVDDLDQEYTSMENLVQLFHNWKQSYPEEYRQCYANLSLGDLAAILVQIQFCQSSRLLLLLSPSDTTTDDNDDDDGIAGLMQQIEAIDNKTGKEEGSGGGMQRVIEKNQLSFLVKLLKEAPTACFVSSKQCRVLSSFLQDCLPNLVSDQESKAFENIQELILTSIQEVLDTIAIPIVKKDTISTETVATKSGLDSNQLEHAVHFANRKQVLLVQHLLLNMLTHWIPQLRILSNHDQLVKCLLDFCSSKFLFLLSSMDSKDAALTFAPIWEILSRDHAQLLESPEFIIQSAPMRAAAMAYGLSPSA